MGACYVDVKYTARNLKNKYNDNYDRVIDDLIQSHCKDKRRIAVQNHELPDTLRELNSFVVVIDRRGYIVIYYSGYGTWRGIVMKKTDNSGEDIKVDRNNWNKNIACYVGHHVP